MTQDSYGNRKGREGGGRQLVGLSPEAVGVEEGVAVDDVVTVSTTGKVTRGPRSSTQYDSSWGRKERSSRQVKDLVDRVTLCW